VKEKHNRRQFLKYSAISGIGLSIDKSAIRSFMPNEVRFKRIPGTSVFEPDPALTVNMIIYVKDAFADNDFQLSQAFGNNPQYPTTFALIFFKGAFNINSDVLDKLKSVTEDSKWIVWTDRLDPQELPNAFTNAAFRIDDTSVIQFPNGYGNVGGDGGVFNIKKSAGNPSIRFDGVNNSFFVETSAVDPFTVTANLSVACMQQIEIPLVNNRSTFGYATLVPDTAGSIRFKTTRYQTNSAPVKPFAPYFFDDAGVVSLQKITYFNEASLIQHPNIIFTFFPYIAINNKTTPRTTLEFNGALILTDFIDAKGARYLAANTKKFSCRLAVVTKDQDAEYLFIPEGTIGVTNNTGADSHLLLGYSGNERINAPFGKLDITFNVVDELHVNDDAGTITLWNHSKTSMLSFTTVAYYLDNDKAPLFDNYTSAANGSTFRKVPYKPVYLAKTSNQPIPIIPTLAFHEHTDTHDDHLQHKLQLEKTFIKQRFEHFKNNASPQITPAPALITPQGFIKTGSDYQYTKREPNPKGTGDKGNPRVSKETNYRFYIRNNQHNLDFQLSISKEDVFFVLTPALIRDIVADLDIEVDVFLSILGFDIDLIYKNISSPFTHDESIIIIKNSRNTINDLYKDTSKWSNYGRFANNQSIQAASRTDGLSPLQAGIQKQFTALDKQGDNPDYDYINKTIRNDRNWNGVLILNIPIKDPGDLPPVFTGLTSSQNLQPAAGSSLLSLETPLNFSYVAFPVNKTLINNGVIDIQTTSFYALIDYDNIKNPHDNYKDKQTITDYLSENDFRFVLCKLLVRFANSEIAHFNSIAFLKTPQFFEDDIKIDATLLDTNPQGHPDHTAVPIGNMIRLDGNYQNTAGGVGEFRFDLTTNIMVSYTSPNAIIGSLTLKKASFYYEGGSVDRFRFDFDASAQINLTIPGLSDILSFKSLNFQNIGFVFPNLANSIPKLSFNVDHLIVLPEISFDGLGFFNSFPFKFDQFKAFNITNFNIDDFDFMSLDGYAPKFSTGNLWSLIFDLDLGTLGNLGLFQNLKAQFVFGWSKGGGMKLGLKINEGSAVSIHIDLFGALRIDIDAVHICQLQPTKQFIIQLNNARLTVLGLELPGSGQVANIVLMAQPGNKVGWLLVDTNDHSELVLAIGQRSGVPGLRFEDGVDSSLTKLKTALGEFHPIDMCRTGIPPNLYNSSNDWMVASERVIPSEWGDFIKVKFIFNDPQLYGMYIGFASLFNIDIAYKKLSDNLGVWSLVFGLAADLRTINLGEIAITLPDLAIDVSTAGDWRLDIGYPVGSDWSRSAVFQLEPFVGWAGIYLARYTSVELSLFGPYECLISKNNKPPKIIQAGLALRVGIGGYIDGGIYYVGASISVYGILEGAFGFDQNTSLLGSLFPHYFALMGRVGAIAELVGYVDFKIVKAAIHLILQVEIGLLLVYLEGNGLQPVPMYIAGTVSVSIDFTIACFSFFGHHFCITIHLSFSASVSFSYTIGGNKAACPQHLAARNFPTEINVSGIGELPVVFIPTFTTSTENGVLKNHMVITFAIPFFGLAAPNGSLTQVSAQNILKDKLLTPLFKAILTAYTSLTYSEFKQVLLTGARLVTDDEVPFTFDYSQVFITGFNKDIAETSDFDTVLENYYGLLNSDERNLYYQNKTQQIYRFIPLPSTPHVSVYKRGVKDWDSMGKGYQLSVAGIFSDVPSASVTIPETIGVTNADINTLDQQFDAYKTQFDHLQDPALQGNLIADMQDIRSNCTTPEYFKLIGLLALEAVYYSLLDAKNPDGTTNRNVAHFDPVFDNTNYEQLLGLFSKADAVETLIARINYFFNNGLQFQDVVNHTNNNIPLYSLLKQTADFTGNLKNPQDFNDLHINLNSIAPGQNYSFDFKDELFPDPGNLVEFVSRGAMQLCPQPADATNITAQFLSELVTAPYQLIDLKLPVPNSNIGGNENGAYFNFYPIPAVIGEHFLKDTQNVLGVVLSDVGTPSVNDTNIAAVVCINVTFKVKPNAVSGQTVALEFSNVMVDDLNLINKVVFNLPAVLCKDIKLYLMDSNNQLTSLPHDGTKIIRTNLSPTTHPPVIIANELASPDPSPLKNYADMSDHQSFLHLLWEGLTTNDGGYFITNPTTQTAFASIPPPVAGKTPEYTLVISIEETIAGTLSPSVGFSNYFKVFASQQGINLQDRLKSTNQHLFTDVLLNELSAANTYTRTVKQYYPGIPAHCFGFEVERQGGTKVVNGQTVTDSAPFAQYLPLEFAVTNVDNNQSVLNASQVLPIMPQDYSNIVGDRAGKVYYRHLTPLVSYADSSNMNRYNAVGKNFRVDFSIRDIYGFRLAPLPLTINYKHVYFDKLIPVNAWPLLKCSFWLSATAPQMKWTVKIELNVADRDKLLKNDAQVKNISDQLFTIKAQLTDQYCKLQINNQDLDTGLQSWPITVQKKNDLIALIDQAIALIVEPNPGLLNAVWTQDFVIALNPFKTLLYPTFELYRDVSDNWFVQLPQTAYPNEIWEANTMRSMNTPIVLDNGAGLSPTLQLDNTAKKLNDALSNTGYVVGIGTENNQHVPFLINTAQFTTLAHTLAPSQHCNYLGITPYSNSFWSGFYDSSDGASQSFTGIDLDQALRTVLQKVDNLLSGQQLGANTDLDTIDQLIALKKKLVKGKADISAPSDDFTELSNRIECFNETGAKTCQPFEDRLLEKLDNYYAYDGIVHQTLTINEPNNLAGHRLTFGVKQDPNVKNPYQIDNAKLDCRNAGQLDWFTFFKYAGTDLNGPNSFYQFKIAAQVTHLEYAINPINDGSGIEQSSWIQLIDPFPLTNVPVNQFPVTYRSCPPVPVITLNQVGQMTPDDGHSPWSTGYGGWNYQLGVQDGGDFQDNDRMYINLAFKTVGTNSLNDVSYRTFEGFLAYWSNAIAAGRLDAPGDHLRHFVTDLDDELQRPVQGASLVVNPAVAASEMQVVLKKTNGVWKVISLPEQDSPFNIFGLSNLNNTPITNGVTIGSLVFGVFNIFANLQIVSVKPTIWLTRNENVANPDFTSFSPKISPASWTTAHLQYFKPVITRGNLLQNVIADLCRTANGAQKNALPFKCTAKYLVKIQQLTPQIKTELPAIAVEQMDFQENGIIQVNVDGLFTADYQNGYPALSLAVYNLPGGEENELPVFTMQTIYKP
jgi:hypothetical protein